RLHLTERLNARARWGRSRAGRSLACKRRWRRLALESGAGADLRVRVRRVRGALRGAGRRLGAGARLPGLRHVRGAAAVLDRLAALAPAARAAREVGRIAAPRARG